MVIPWPGPCSCGPRQGRPFHCYPCTVFRSDTGLFLFSPPQALFQIINIFVSFGRHKSFHRRTLAQSEPLFGDRLRPVMMMLEDALREAKDPLTTESVNSGSHSQSSPKPFMKFYSHAYFVSLIFLQISNHCFVDKKQPVLIMTDSPK